MKLNSDCIRSVMLMIEEKWELGTDPNGNIRMGYIGLRQLCTALPEYSKEDIFYSLYNLEQAGYLDLSILWAGGRVAIECDVNYITYEGHEFLNRIRDTKRWTIIKGGLNAVRDYSLSAISSVAEGVANAAISKYVENLQL